MVILLVAAASGAAPDAIALGPSQPAPACVAAATARLRALLRPSPSLRDRATIAVMPRGETAYVTGRTSDRGWYRVVFDEREGWVQARMVDVACEALVPVVPGVPSPSLARAAPATPTRASAEFRAQPERIFAGACSMLLWRSPPGATVNFVEGERVIDVSATGAVIVCPAVTTAYLLHVQPRGGAPFHEVAIVAVAQPTPSPLPPTPTVTPSPTPPPPQLDFRADAPSVVLGACTVLRWSASGARAAYLWDGASFQPVGLADSRIVCPPNSTIYMLRVAGDGGIWYERTAGVTVIPPTVAPWLITPMP